ncbi:hypothetical protein Tco_1438940 [Tanacetum coccineum]
MLKVAKLSQEPEKSLIPPSEEVNADDSANKSPSRTSVQPVTQPKAPTAKRLRKKKRSSLTQPEVSKSSRILKSSSSQATHLQPAKDFVVIADTTKGLYASESAKVQGNQPKAAEAKKQGMIAERVLKASRDLWSVYRGRGDLAKWWGEGRLKRCWVESMGGGGGHSRGGRDALIVRGGHATRKSGGGAGRQQGGGDGAGGMAGGAPDDRDAGGGAEGWRGVREVMMGLVGRKTRPRCRPVWEVVTWGKGWGRLGRGVGGGGDVGGDVADRECEWRRSCGEGKWGVGEDGGGRYGAGECGWGVGGGCMGGYLGLLEGGGECGVVFGYVVGGRGEVAGEGEVLGYLGNLRIDLFLGEEFWSITVVKLVTDLSNIMKRLNNNKGKTSLQLNRGQTKTLISTSASDMLKLNITPKDAEEGDASDSGLRFMPDDDLASLTGFETSDSDENDSEGTATNFNASADMLAQSDPLGYFHEELSTLKSKIDQLESSITKKVQKNFQAQLPSLLLKPMYKEFNAFNKLESRRFVILQEELSKLIKTKLDDSVKTKDLRLMFKDMVSLLDVVEVFKKANVEGEKESNHQHNSEEDTSGKKEDDEPPAKKLKFLISTSSIPSPTPLKSLMPDPPKYTDAIKMTLAQFTKHLTKTTSSIFSPTPPREPTLPRDPTPHRDETKGKGIAIEDLLKDIMPFMEERGSTPKIPNFKSFVIPEGPLIQEDIMAQLKEMKRLADLKAEKEKSKKSLKKILNPATIRDQTQKMINYIVSSSKEASMRITRTNDPLNVTVHKRFRLRTLGFSKWLEVHALASKTNGKSNELLLQSLRAKFEWVLTQENALGIPPPPKLSNFRVPTTDKKRKRSSENLKEVFVKENVEVDEMHRNLVPPPGVEGRRGLVIREPEARIFYYNGNFDLVFQRESEFHLATTVQLVRLQDAIIRDTPEAEEMYNLLDLEIESRNDVNDNLDDMGQHIRIQVKDIVKEVEDHLKTYSSAEMDISWYVEGIRQGSKESQRWQYSDYPVTL